MIGAPKWGGAMTWILDGSDYGDGEPGDPPLAECQDVVGAFADLPTRPGPEHFTLVGCEPRGRLLAAMTGTGERWLANVSVDPSESSDLLMQELTDVTVVGHRPSALVPERLDIDLTGMIRHEPEQEIWELWQRSAPPGRNLWARYDAPMRMQWAGAAMCHDRPKADRRAGLLLRARGGDQRAGRVLRLERECRGRLPARRVRSSDSVHADLA
jgi:hypothetical protein